MVFTQIDSGDVDQALEIACGDAIGSEVNSRRTASERDIARLRSRLTRFLNELPGELSISELRDLLEGVE